MGRKPNALILEFFIRGAKLDDQSNRYEHTCKRCGMFFPKGRPDSMNRHLFEKCTNVSDYDRERALAFAQGQMDPVQIARRFGRDPELPLYQPPGLADPSDAVHPLLAPPSMMNRETSALDTLAEVSRQHLDLTRHRMHADGGGQDTVESQQEVDSWMAQLEQHLAEANEAHDARETQATQTESRSADLQADPLIQTANAAAQLQAQLEEQESPAPRLAPQPAATQLNKRKREDNDTDHNIDPALHGGNHGLASAPLIQETAEQEAQDMPRSVPNLPRPTESPDTGDARLYGLLKRPVKKARRNKFSAEGRKKVGGIRKMGACLRCKMLKKPCSGETPCATCSAIGAPRVWRAACIRTRIADEFTLFNTSYFFARARSLAQDLTGEFHPKNVTGRVEINLFEDPSKPVSFAVCGQPSRGGSEGSRPSRTTHEETHFTLNFENKDPSGIVQRYLEESLAQFIAAETTTSVRNTVGLLHTLTTATNEGHDPLAHNALILWAATTILTGASSLAWTMAYIPHTAPSTRHMLAVTRPDRPVLQAQFLDAVERFASSTVKTVANELERRLLARRGSTPLTTYLSTLVLLNSVERISLFFRRLDARRTTSGSDEEDEDGVPDHWPLTRTPAAYFRQGAAFAQLLSMLLRMRNLPPRTIVSDHGEILVVVRNKPKVTATEMQHRGDSEDAATEDPPVSAEGEFAQVIASWLTETGWTGRELWHRAGLGDDDVGDDEDWKAWDLRFLSLLVLPAHQTIGEVGASHGQRYDAGMTESLQGYSADAVVGAETHDYYDVMKDTATEHARGAYGLDPAVVSHHSPA